MVPRNSSNRHCLLRTLPHKQANPICVTSDSTGTIHIERATGTIERPLLYTACHYHPHRLKRRARCRCKMRCTFSELCSFARQLLVLRNLRTSTQAVTGSPSFITTFVSDISADGTDHDLPAQIIYRTSLSRSYSVAVFRYCAGVVPHRFIPPGMKCTM